MSRNKVSLARVMYLPRKVKKLEGGKTYLYMSGDVRTVVVADDHFAAMYNRSPLKDCKWYEIPVPTEF